MDEERLITLVQQYPCLYVQDDKYYTDKETKENIWKMIGSELSQPAQECRNKWQILRGSFRRAHKLASCGDGKKRKMWKWYETMQFLVPHENDDVFDPSAEWTIKRELQSEPPLPSSSDGTCASSSKRGAGGFGCELAGDPLRSFFVSMYETVRTFPAPYQTQVKMAIFEAVSKAELELSER